MAATPFDASGPGSSFIFDIYNDGQAFRNAPAPAPVLPGGPCNYTDQTLPRCGCRRFWSRVPLRGAGFQDTMSTNFVEICMCSHHACFHEDVQPGQSQPQTQLQTSASFAGQENEKPKANREPLSPVQDLGSFHIPSNFGTSMDFDLMNLQSIGINQPVAPASLPAPGVHPGPESALPDTLNSWGNLIQSEPRIDDDGLPPIPSQCLLPPTQPPSTASSSQGRYLRPFAGRGLHTLNAGSALKHETFPLNNAEPAQGTTASDGPSVGLVPVPARESTPTPGRSQVQPSTSISGEAWRKLSDTVDSHEHRLEKLENASFSIAGQEDCHDKHENVDLRVTELESRVEEVEKILNDNGSIASSRRTVRPEGSPDDATASVVSVSTNATVLGSNRVEMYSQLRSLQVQVSQLQAASLPSYTKPWELEVVFLPFPLKGIWMEAREFPSQRRSAGSNADDWTQMPNTLSRATPDPQSPKFQEWAGQSADSNWLLPRAFASGRVIDQRLRSRGLVKTVLVRGPDARSIHLAIYNSFADVFRISSNAYANIRSGPGSNMALTEFLGLRQPWVPLRKLHKDSRLRFLSPAEMATPTLWDFTFLMSSVVMKATGTHRLYVTQPEAYMQDHPLGYHAFESGWSWQKLRQLSRVYPDSQSSVGDLTFPEADAMEDCWAWNDRLDEAPSATSSTLSLRQSHQQRLSRGPSVSPSQQFFTGVQSPILSSSPAAVRASSPFVQRERKDARPLHVRANSIPPLAAALPSPSQSRRRVSAHNSSAAPYERRPSPLITRSSPRLSVHHSGVNTAMATTAAYISKRRLGTRSPSFAPRNTPQWSRSPSLGPGGALSGHHEGRERRPTPNFYATPRSDALPEYRCQRFGSRGPVPAGPFKGFDQDDEDMDDDFGDDLGDDQGSSTDPYDSEMTNDAGDGARHASAHNRTFGLGVSRDRDVDEDEEEDEEITVYEDDDDDELDGIDTDGGQDHGGWDGLDRVQGAGSSEHPRPEDIPWAGIEDRMSDGENVNPESQSQSQSIPIHEDEDMEVFDGDGAGEGESGPESQAPSEYSSRQNAWPTPMPSLSRDRAQTGLLVGQNASQGFDIHEDDSGPETQWAGEVVNFGRGSSS